MGAVKTSTLIHKEIPEQGNSGCLATADTTGTPHALGIATSPASPQRMSTSFINARRTALLLLIATAATACARHEDAAKTDSAAGGVSATRDSAAVDSSIILDRAATPAVGPG